MNKINSEVIEEELTPVATKGGGSCAFHAVEGKWDPHKKQFTCSDFAKKRKHVAHKVKHCKEGDSLFPLVKQAIKAMIMEGIKIEGERIRKAQEDCKVFLDEKKGLMKNCFDTLFHELKQHQEVITYIDSFIKTYIDNYQKNKGKEMDSEVFKALSSKFFDKFFTCLSEDNGTLKKSDTTGRAGGLMSVTASKAVGSCVKEAPQRCSLKTFQIHHSLLALECIFLSPQAQSQRLKQHTLSPKNAHQRNFFLYVEIFVQSGSRFYL